MEDVTNKLRLNQWINSSIADIQKKTDKQVSWSAIDATIAEEDESNGLCTFAAKFKTSDIADNFVEFFKLQGANNEVVANINKLKLKEQKSSEDVNDDDKESEVDTFGNVEAEDPICVMLEEYDAIQIQIWNEDEWKKLAENSTLRLMQNPNDGIMRVVCRDKKRDKLRINHVIPDQTESLKERADNTIEWSTSNKNDDGQTFSAKFQDSDTANKFFEYFKAGSMNNSSIEK